MSSSSCKGCGAPLPVEATKCPYCHAPAPVSIVALAPEVEADVKAFVATIEEQLAHAKDDDDWMTAASLVFLGGCVVGAWFGLGAANVVGASRWVFTALAFGVGFCVFGFVVGNNETRALSRCYRKRSREQIARYLEARGLRRVDFDGVAAKTLAPDAKLRRFLFDVEPARGAKGSAETS